MLQKILVLLLLTLALYGCSKKGHLERQVPITEMQQKEDTIKKSDEVQYLMSEEGILTICGNGTAKGDDLRASLMALGFDVEDVIKIVIDNGITGIDKYCFEEYPNVISVTMANSVKVIGVAAFTGCDKLEVINISEGVTKIGKEAFSYCKSLKKLTLPNSLKHYAPNAICGCSSLTEIENKSSNTWKLSTEGVAKRWYCEGKPVKKILAGKTVSVQSVTYRLIYDLNGGVAKGKLPVTYESGRGCKIPKSVKRDGYFFVNWMIGDDVTDTISPGETGKRTVRAFWIKFQLENKSGGKVRVLWDLDTCDYDFLCLVRYSQSKDMSNWEFVNVPSNATETVLKNLKKDRHCYVEYAVIEDLDDWDELAELPWQGKQSIVVK